MLIDVPESLFIETIPPESLSADWYSFQQYDACQRIGGEWLRKGQSAVLKVPSAIIPHEWNYLLNPAHPDFARVKLLRTEPFVFDPRIKE